MKFSKFLKALLVSALAIPFASCDIIKFLDDCTSHCKKVHTKYGNIHSTESNPTKVKHTAEDIAFTACLQRCRLSEIIRPKSTSEMGNI